MPVSIMRFDMRAPASSPASAPELYAAALDMAQWADAHGFSLITLSEHHGTEDGYLPAPLVMAGLVAGRTQRVGISVMALIAPLHDPIRLAEEIAVLDLASGGRVSVVLGLGYRREEYAAAGRDWGRRGQLLDEAIEKMLRAWSGDLVGHNGAEVHVTPRPATRPHPRLAVGGGSRAAARRAARFGLPFAPQVDDPELADFYRAECARLGVEGGFVLRPAGVRMVLVSEDPERTWRELGPYILHDTVEYASWQRPGLSSAVASSATTLEQVRAEGLFQVLTPEEYVERARAAGPLDAFIHFPLVGGAPPALAWQSLELYADKVLPYL